MKPAHAASTLLLLAVLGTVPTATSAQGPGLLEGVRKGGGWIAIPIEDGVGRLSTRPIPTLGLRFDGCLTVWGGHSGAWTLDARDVLSGERLEAVALPGRGLPFSHQAGVRSQVEVEVRWTEARDTVLQVWVGLDRGDPTRDPCQPVYGTGGDETWRRTSDVRGSASTSRPLPARVSGNPGRVAGRRR